MMDKFDWLNAVSEEILKENYKLKEISDKIDYDLKLQGILKLSKVGQN